MSKRKELMRKYKNWEISASRIFKEQDEVLAGQFFIGCGKLSFYPLLFLSSCCWNDFNQSPTKGAESQKKAREYSLAFLHWVRTNR